MTTVRLLIVGASLALTIAPVPAVASDFCSDVSYIVGLKGQLAGIATGPFFSLGQVHDIPGAAEQRTTFNVTGAYRCGLGERFSDGQLYMCDFASGGQSVVSDELQSCYPEVTPTAVGEDSRDWNVSGARIEVTNYGSGANVNLTIWPPASDTGDLGDDDWPF